VVGQLLDMDLAMPCDATWLIKALNKAESAVVQRWRKNMASQATGIWGQPLSIAGGI
jgi:hypothetical protein